jgi:hypothetical protein
MLMSDNLDTDKIFAYTIASVKDIGDIIKDLMSAEYFHMALEFLDEEKKALLEAKKLLAGINNKRYQDTFGEMIPNKLKDIEFAIKFCNNRLIDGKYKLMTGQEEYKYDRKKREIKVKNLKKLKSIALNTNEWQFADYLDTEIRKEENKMYQA